MTGSDRIAIVWFRRDLRLRDNPAWAAATRERDAVVPLYVLDPRLLATAGPYRRRSLVASLQALDYDLFERTGGRLLVRIGDPTTLVPEAVEVLQAGALVWNGDTTPYATRRDRRVRAAVTADVDEHWGTLVAPPGSVVDGDGRVPLDPDTFVATWRDLPLPDEVEAGDALVYDDPGEPLPRLDGRPPLPEGEGEAAGRLARLLERLDAGTRGAEALGSDASSFLAADLRFGVLSPRVVAAALVGEGGGDVSDERTRVLTGLARRDWLAHLVGDRPEVAAVAPGDDTDRWRVDPAGLSAWKGGFTGFPAVDAAMRQLRETGWLSGPARTLVAEFLTAHLNIDWREGEAHLRRLLVDGDVCQNVGNWRLVAGVMPGPDGAAAPRATFDPVGRSRAGDPDGRWIVRWVPELAGLGADHPHAPWAAPDDVLEGAGIALGSDYPRPVESAAAERPSGGPVRQAEGDGQPGEEEGAHRPPEVGG